MYVFNIETEVANEDMTKMMIQRRFFPTPMIPPHRVRRVIWSICNSDLVSSTTLSKLRIRPDRSVVSIYPTCSLLYLQSKQHFNLLINLQLLLHKATQTFTHFYISPDTFTWNLTVSHLGGISDNSP